MKRTNMPQYFGVYIWTVNQMIDFLNTQKVKNYDKTNPLSDFEHYMDTYKTMTDILKYGKRLNCSVDKEEMIKLYNEYYNKYEKKSPHYCVKLVDCSVEKINEKEKLYGGVISYLKTKEKWRKEELI